MTNCSVPRAAGAVACTLGQRAVRADALIDETPLNLWFAATHNTTRRRRRGGGEYNGEKRRGNLRLSYN